jgi:micrococcal nuclease
MIRTGKIITVREQLFRLNHCTATAALWLGASIALLGCSTPRTTFTVERATPTTSQPIDVSGSGSQETPESIAAALSGTGPVVANATVSRISDGDTVTVTFAGGAESKVRLIGIDTPETKRPNTPIQCFGPEATRFIAALIPVGTALRIERDVEATDRYGRLLAYVYRASDGLFVNRALVEYGFANLLTYPPNVAHVDQFRDAVDSARQNDRGLWRACPATVSP